MIRKSCLTSQELIHILLLEQTMHKSDDPDEIDAIYQRIEEIVRFAKRRKAVEIIKTVEKKQLTAS